MTKYNYLPCVTSRASSEMHAARSSVYMLDYNLYATYMPTITVGLFAEKPGICRVICHRVFDYKCGFADSMMTLEQITP